MLNFYFLASTENCTHENCHPRIINKSLLSICPFPNKLCDSNTTCVSVEMLCNGKNDCLDGSDEGELCGKLVNIIHSMDNIFLYT